MSNREYENRESSRKDESSNSFLAGAIIGGMIGAAVALLFAPKTGRELRSSLTSSTNSIVDLTSDLKRNVKTTRNKLLTKTSTISQGLAQQSSELLNKVRKSGESTGSSEVSEGNYISLSGNKESSETKKQMDNFELRRKIEETQKALEDEENKVHL